jgi:ribose transport system substrate-binding protein
MPDSKSHRRELLPMFALVVTVLTVAASGCGGSGDGSGDVSSASSADAKNDPAAKIVAEANQQVDQLYKGTYKLPSGTSPTPASGKTIWAISAGQQALSPVNATRGLQTAGRVLGWNVKIWDGKYDPSQWLAGVRQAVSAKADGIWLYSFDCTPVKAAMQEAKRAGIPVVIAQGVDCGSGANSLAAHVAAYNTGYDNGVISTKPGTFQTWNEAFGGIGAWWIVAKTKGQAKVIEFVETDIQATLQANAGVDGVLKRCSTCKVVDKVEFTGADLGPKLQQKAQQALLQHPEANAITGNYDTAVTSGIAAAVRSAHRKIYLAGGEGYQPNMDLVRGGIQSTGAGYEAGWEGWCGADDFIYLFAKQRPRVCGVGVMAYDLNHNLAPKGQNFSTRLDYEQAYKKSWGVAAGL